MKKLSRKLDARAQIQIATGELGDDLEVMLRLDEDLTNDQQRSLENAGCTFKSAHGKVVIGQSKRIALEDIAELDFVQRIEVSRTLYQEKPTTDQPDTNDCDQDSAD